MSLRKQLIAAMKASGKTRYVIAQESGVGQSALGKFVAGKDLRLESVEKLADYFGMRLTAPTRNKGGK